MNDKYRQTTRNGCPTGHLHAVEKWTIVCQEIKVSPMMSLSASFWGSFILALFIYGGSLAFNTILGDGDSGEAARSAFLIVPLLHGIGLFVVVSSVFGISGTGNPGLTFAFWAGQKITGFDALLYVLGSTFGWVIASAVLLIFTPVSVMLAGIPALQADVGLFEGIFWEFIASFAWGIALTFIVNKPVQDFTAGLGLTAGMWIAWPYTRSALNIHRVLGPAIALLLKGNTEYWTTDIFAYLIGSPVGFLAAVFVYYFSFQLNVDHCAKSKMDTKC